MELEVKEEVGTHGTATSLSEEISCQLSLCFTLSVLIISDLAEGSRSASARAQP